MQSFLSKGQDRKFKDWLARHPHGFYLNEEARGSLGRGVGHLRLHRSACYHLGDGEGVISTSYAKVACNERDQLTEWASKAGFDVVPCKSCQPFGGTATVSSKPQSSVIHPDPMTRYQWGLQGTPHTDPDARVCGFRPVTDVLAIRITGGLYRSAPVSGTFEMYDPTISDPVETKPGGKKEVQVICAWYGGRPNKRSGVHVNVTNAACRVEVLNNFTGYVVDDIGPVSIAPKKSETASVFPDEVSESKQYVEGATKQVLVNVYERDTAAREACIAHFGTVCQVCSFDFAATYGELGNGFIHVHHTRPLSKIRSSYIVDPIRELVPVCPNCHAMLHRESPPLEIAVLRKRLRPVMAGKRRKVAP